MNLETQRVLIEYIPGWIWLKDYPIRYAGCRFNARMTILRLGDGRLLIHSPSPIDAGTKADIKTLGSVALILAPGNFHYLNVASAQDAFPEARTYVCPGVEKKCPTLSYTGILRDEPEDAWAKDLDQVLLRGSRFIWEVAFFHRASKTLVLVDLIENFGDDTIQGNWVLRFWWKYIFRMWNHPKPAPEYQLGWKDKIAARRSLGQILEWDFDKIVLAHGDLIEREARRVALTAWQSVLDR